jgi:hypothetical protein
MEWIGVLRSGRAEMRGKGHQDVHAAFDISIFSQKASPMKLQSILPRSERRRHGIESILQRQHCTMNFKLNTFNQQPHLPTDTDTMVEKRLPRPCKKAIDYNVTTLSRLAEGKEPTRPTPPAVRPPRQPRIRNPREKKKPTVTKKPTGTRDKTRTPPTPAAPTPGSGRPASRESSDSEDIIRKTKEGRVEKKKKEKKDNKKKKVYSDSDDEPLVPPHHNDSDDDSDDEDYHNDAPAAAKEKKKPSPKEKKTPTKKSDKSKKETPTKSSKNKKQAEDDDESDEYFSGREGMPTPAATLGMAQNRGYALKMTQYLKDREAGKLKGKGKSKKKADEKK